MTLSDCYRELGRIITARYAERGKIPGRDREPEIDDEIAADPEALAALAAIRAARAGADPAR